MKRETKTKRMILAVVYCVVVTLPCLLIFFEPLSWTNFAAMAYLGFLVMRPTYVFPTWVRRYIDVLVRDE